MSKKAVHFISLVMVTLGVSSFGLNYDNIISSAWAKAKTVKVVKTKKLKGKAYRAKKGYLYKNKRLTKKAWSLKRHQKTTFYAKKQITVRKHNGKKAVYYYVVTKNKRTKGYIWRGNLKRYVSKQKTKAKVTITNHELKILIDQSPDLDPTGQLLNLTKVDYQKYEDVFESNFNLDDFSADDVFVHHQATLYVKDTALMPVTKRAIAKWNQALGRTVFQLGTKANHTMTVELGDGQADHWDGLYSPDVIEVDRTNFNDAQYESTTVKDPVLSRQYQNFKTQIAKNKADFDAQSAAISQQYQDKMTALSQQISQLHPVDAKPLVAQKKQLAKQRNVDRSALKKAYNQRNRSLREQQDAILKQMTTTEHANYWVGVVMHELGHSLGLDHTPYFADIVYAGSNREGEYESANIKYPWSEGKGQSTNSGVDTQTLSQRDVDRAKLTEKLGYW